jgi:glutamate synthase domain-containing protein 2
MSFGSLSENAIMALNKGALKGNFYHNTGEGGLTEFHQQGGDVTWQIGTGYFGCRDDRGRFDGGKFAEKANIPEVKMI